MFFVHAENDRQKNERDCKKNERIVVCRAEIERLHFIINRNRCNTRNAWHIATHHQHDTELAELMRERECKRGNKRRLDIGKKHFEERGSFRFAKCV